MIHSECFSKSITKENPDRLRVTEGLIFPETLLKSHFITKSGRGAVWLARLHGVQEAPGSNPGAPTVSLLPVRLPEP